MAKLGYSPVIILGMLSFFAFGVEDGGQRNPEDQGREPLFSEMLRRMFSGSTTSPASARYWEKVGTFMDDARAFFFPPNIESGDEAEANAGGGSGEKVKEAVTKSLGKSKAAVEDSAKSAAKIATETVKKTKEKVRNSLSEREGKQQQDL